MRITNGMLVTNMLRNTNSNLNRLERLQQQASSGRMIKYASQDPVIATRSIKLTNYVAEIEQMQKNTDDAASWLDFTDASLKQLNEDLQRIRELTVSASNDTNSDDERQAILKEIVELRKSVIDIGNSSYNGRYIFAGYDTDEAPFEMASTLIGNKIMYKGKYLSLGGPVSSSVSDADYKAFYLANMDKISGQPELTSANYETFTAAAPNLDFTVTLDGVSQTISLTDGTTYDISTIQAELQSQLNTAFPAGTGQPDPLIKVSTVDGKLKLTVQDGSSVKLSGGTLDIKQLGFTEGITSKKDSKEEIQYKVGNGNRVTINAEGDDVFGQGDDSMFNTLAKLEMALAGETSYKTATYTEGPPADVVVETHELDIGSLLDDLDNDMDRILKARSEIGARSNYVELTQNRLESNDTTFTELLSKTIDVDYAEVSMKLSSAEAVYKAALSAGASVIQPSLLDFLK